MPAQGMMNRLAEVIDAHRWDELPALLHPEFSCHYVHTGETLDRESWVRVNADYPGFQDFELVDCIADHERAAGRAHVTGTTDGELQQFEVATFITVRDDLIFDMTEVWTDVNLTAPAGTRPQ